MRKVPGALAFLVGIVLLTGVGHAQWPEATIRDMFAWDYPAGVVGANAVWFELQIDGRNLTRVEVSVLPSQPESYFTRVPPMPVGQHLVEIRACNLSGCSGWSSPIVFSFSHRLEGFVQ